jgi:hypothetical protein
VPAVGFASTSPPAVPPPPAGFASLIVADFPALFAEFGGKRFRLLWRGSRDGFRAGDFHGRCDGNANPLTLILDTGGEHFRGRYAGGVGVVVQSQGRSESEEFSFHAEESPQRPGEEICAEDRNEGQSNLV